MHAFADPYYPQPPGHAELLAKRPDLAFTRWVSWETDFDLLERVNLDVNASMTYRPDGNDIWGVGSDCEDYAVRKLETLLRAGVPRGALRLAIARVDQRGHAVLVVRDEWILDNLHDEILRRGENGFRIEAWETEGGNWNPAGAFATLTDHLKWSSRPFDADPEVP
jgi:predicted transglutaminase-like cysteine proteinase